MNDRFWWTFRLRIHPAFWLVALLAVWGGFFLELITLLGLIAIHELGHLSAARYFGWRIDTIELLPFGGVLITDEWGTVPAVEEMIVALAGPLYNGAMIVFGAICYMSGWWTEAWTNFFVTANGWLAVFNLLPVYPLDGGRLLQAVLSYHMPYRKCIAWSIGASFALSVLMCLISLIPLAFGRPLLFNVGIIALFLLFSNVMAWRQKHYQYLRFLMQRQRDETIWQKPVDPLVVTLEDTVLEAVRQWKKEVYHVVIVKDDQGHVVRILPEEKVLQYFFENRLPGSKLRELFSLM